MATAGRPSKWDSFVGMLSPDPKERILDVGAGKGSVASRVLEASKGAEVYAVDPNEKRVASIKRDFPEIKSSVAGAESLPFPDAYFDKAYATMALHHFSNLDIALREIGRVLKHGGAFVIQDVDPGSAKGRLFRFFSRLAGEHINLMTEEHLTARVGFVGTFGITRSTRWGSDYLVLLTRS